MRNSKRARRWRLVMFARGSVNYSLDCKISDRVAIIYAAVKPYSWAVYGWPNENGVPHCEGSGDDLSQVKRDARQALDNLVIA